MQALSSVLAQSPTVVDPSFDPGTGANDDVFATMLQPDGKILIAGQFTQVNGASRSRVARFNADGSLDSTFDSANGPNNTVYALALQRDGKVVIGGAFSSLGGAAIQYLARLNSDGSIDPTFMAGTTINNELRAITLQSDGSLVIGGRFTSVAGQSRRRVARLLPDGTLDASFDPGTGANDSIRTMALQADGRILVGGQFTSFNGVAADHLARLQTNGLLDPTCCDSVNAFVRTVAVQPDGRILIGGDFSIVGTVPRALFARLLATGAVDTTFDPGVVNGVTARVIAASPGDKVLIGGDFASVGGTPRTRIARLNADASVDPSFDPGSGAQNEVFCLAVQPDGRILAGGQFTNINNTVRFHVARLLSDTTQPAVEFTAATFSTNENAGAAVIFVRRTGRMDGTVNVDFATANGTATAGLDYVATSGTLVFAPGELEKSFVVRVLKDADLDGRETVRLVLSNAVGAILGANRAATLELDDSTVWVDFSNFGVFAFEGEPSVVVGLGRVGAQGAFRVRATALSGTALAGIDFVGVTNEFLFAAGQGQALFSIPILNDGLIEENKEFTLLLFDPVDVYLGSHSTLNVTLVDNDHGVSFAVTNYSVSEREPFAELLVQRGNDGTNIISVHYTTENGTAIGGEDFVATSGILTFGAGESVKTIRMPLLRDCIIENPKKFAVRLSQPSAETRVDEPSVATITIFEPGVPGQRDVTFRAPSGLISPTVVQPDGKIVSVFGSVDNVVSGQNGVLRLMPDGSLDPAFDTNGVIDPGDRPLAITALGLQPDGKIVVAGWRVLDEGLGRHAVLRVTENGALDANFHSSHYTGVCGPDHFSIVTQPDGKILLGNRISSGIYRLASNGDYDASFRAVVDAGNGIANTVFSIALQSDGKILIGGEFTEVNGATRNHIARLNPDGTLDPTFDPGSGADGPVYSVQSGRTDVGTNVPFSVTSSQPGTNIIETGTPAGVIRVDYEFFFTPDTLRIYYDDVLVYDTGLTNGSGSFEVEYGPGPGTAVKLVANEGRGNIGSLYSYSGSVKTTRWREEDVLIGGAFSSVNGRTNWGIARLRSDGSVDEAFHLGTLLAPFAVSTVVWQPDGKVLAGAVATQSPAPEEIGVVRLNPDGTPDRSFEWLPCLDVYGLGVQPDGGIIVAGVDRCAGGERQLLRLYGGPQARFTGLQREIGGVTRLTLEGTPGIAAEVQASSDLRAWTVIARVNLNDCAETIVDTAAPDAPYRFYRARPVPARQ